MNDFLELLRHNHNYHYTWIGQVVSEIGDHFNNIAVFSLAMETTHSGLVVSGVMLSRAVPAVMAGPLAGVLLDRLDRKRIMIASDLIRAFVALAFVLTVHHHQTWLLYGLSALLMFASPFFTSGRTAILPTITNRGGTPHRQLTHPDDGVDHADHRNHGGGPECREPGVSVGIRIEFTLLFCVGRPASGSCARQAAFGPSGRR